MTYRVPNEFRDYLRAWRVGKTRRVFDVRDALLDIRPCFPIQHMTHWIDHGYLTTKDSHLYHLQATVTRTALEVPPIRRRKVTKKPYVGVYPWSEADHWEAIEQAPYVLPARVLWSLDGTRKPKDMWHRSRCKDYGRAVWIDTRSTLQRARRDLLLFLDGKEPKWMPLKLQKAYLNAYGFRCLLLEMLVRPVFVGGRFVKFEAIDGEAARIELERLHGIGQSYTDKIREAV